MANAVRNGGKMLALLAAGMFFSVGLSAKGDASPGLNIIGDANAKRTINGDRTVLTFTKSGKMRVVGSGTVEVLLVGGGGGGGRNHATDDNLGGGGGGGGGVVYTNSIAIREGIWDVSVGAGGEIGRNGCATTIEGLGLMAYGGGAGADNGTRNPDTGNIGWHGASGGGSTYNQPAGKAIYASSGNFGNDGAVAVHIYGAAGGGGAGAVAPALSGTTPGNGGDGLEFSISGTATYYGGGGSGYRGGQYPVGGNGGGGYCANSRKFAGEDGLGGGGCGGTKGGSGVVIVSFVATDPAPVESELDIIGISNAVRSVQGERTILTLTKSGSVRVIGSGTIELLMVGGGGGGGANHATDGNLGGGGGGAGGVVYKSSFPVTKGVYDVAIGEGGAIGTNGGNTTIVGWGVTAYGGGAGGAYNGSAAGVANAKNGASGGGSSSGTVGNAIYGDQGNFGHDGYKGTHQYGPGGGGGAGAAAVANPNGASTPGAGGDGLEFSISGTPTYYAGGGAGYRMGRGADSSWKAYGGNGGGGYAETNGKLHAGVDGLGGGGGGGTKGGSGIVIICFVAKASASPDFDISGADEVYKVGKERVLIFRQPGTMKVTGHGLMEVLAVGGGGGGGANHATKGDYGGGGGGGGGVFHMNSIAVSAGDYPVVIGEGGAIGTNGGHTKIEGAGVVAYGGGAGGACCDSSTNVGNPGADGASGGGSTSGKDAGKAIYSTAGNQGHDGYAATHQYAPGGGGGAGAAAVVNPYSASTPGAGGDGLEFSITGTPTYYAGGGAGYRKGRGSSYVFKAYGGLGGGGSASDAGVITPGIDGLGGGGCGGSKGGSGILIVRYTPPPPGMLLIVR